jgi:hypothetical protein
MVWELCSTLTQKKAQKRRYQHGDVRLSQCRSTKRIDGLKALIDGTDSTSPRLGHWRITSWSTRNSSTMNFTTCRQSSRLKTPRCTLTDGICPSNTSVQVNGYGPVVHFVQQEVYRHVHGIRRCAMRSGFHDHPSHGPTTEDLPTILQVRRKGSLWFTYVLDDLDAKSWQMSTISTPRGSDRYQTLASGCSKGTWDRVIRSQKDSFCLILRRYSYHLTNRTCVNSTIRTCITVISWINEFFVIEAACVGDWFHCLIPVLIPVAPES